MDSLDVREILNRLEYHYHHDSSAVRISDDVARTVQCILSIALRNYQRHVVTHTESTGVVDHHSAILSDSLSEFLACATASRSECDVHVLEIIVVLQEFDLVFLAFECVFSTSGTFASE